MEHIQFLSASLVPIIAILGLLFAWLQWRTNEKKRQNELFNLRYDFYQRVRKAYLSQHDETNPPILAEDWIPLAEEARFLFGKDIEKHISSFADKEVSGHPDFPDDWFVKPFEKYLKL